MDSKKNWASGGTTKQTRNANGRTDGRMTESTERSRQKRTNEKPSERTRETRWTVEQPSGQLFCLQS